MIRTLVLSLPFLLGPPLWAKVAPLEQDLRARFKKTYGDRDNSKKERLRRDVLLASGKAVPILVEVMKENAYPDGNRWLATFLLGRIMGKKASPFIAKFIDHPHWILRMAALKTLLVLSDTRYAEHYARALKDDALLVRWQALDNIVRLNLKKQAPSVWAMLYDKRNYYNQKEKQGRTNIIRSIIRAIGKLGLGPAVGPLVSMMQKDEYLDIYPDIEYSLHRITGRKRPNGGIQARRRYWSQAALGFGNN